MDDRHTLSAIAVKATWPEVMDRIARGEWERVAITKRGKVMAVLGAAPFAWPWVPRLSPRTARLDTNLKRAA